MFDFRLTFKFEVSNSIHIDNSWENIRWVSLENSHRRHCFWSRPHRETSAKFGGGIRSLCSALQLMSLNFCCFRVEPSTGIWFPYSFTFRRFSIEYEPRFSTWKGRVRIRTDFLSFSFVRINLTQSDLKWKMINFRSFSWQIRWIFSRYKRTVSFFIRY